jgi:hypothetical protein
LLELLHVYDGGLQVVAAVFQVVFGELEAHCEGDQLGGGGLFEGLEFGGEAGELRKGGTKAGG